MTQEEETSTGAMNEAGACAGNNVNKGDIFVTSWGYDQTNYDYIVVNAVSPTGKTVTCQCARYDTVGTTFQDNIQRPTANGYGDEFRMQVRQYDSSVWLVGSYPFCNGNREHMRRGSFSRWDGRRNFYETDGMFGH